MAYVWFCCIVAIWGSSFILMKRAVLAMSPLGVGTGRVMFGVAVLGLVWWSAKSVSKLRRHDAWVLVMVIVLGFAWPYCVQPALISRHGGAFVGMTVGFTPLLTLGVSALLLQSWPTLRQTVGVIGALACLCLLMWDGWQRAIPLMDLWLAFTVPLTYAVANASVRRWLQHVPPLELSVWCLGGATAGLLPLALIAPGPVNVSWPDWTTAWLSVAVLGVLGTGLATCLFLRLVQEQGPLFAAMVTNLVPVFAVAWGWFDAEPINSRQLLALAGVLVMVGVVQYGAARPPATVSSSRSTEPATQIPSQTLASTALATEACGPAGPKLTAQPAE
jgi:drug/metabolite transporter (DMT)-like permease